MTLDFDEKMNALMFLNFTPILLKIKGEITD